ncbi:hyalin-like [Amphiura filiformis]|uniref:hyalin-like n=1 Tax=Amphiura filiformis TaxID=82378 RepID=UPI003B2212FC
MDNDYSYAYKVPKTGQGESNGGFESENGSKNSTVVTAIPASTNCKEKNSGKCRVFCCCLPFIICLICLVVVVIVWLTVTPLKGLVCGTTPSSINSSVAGLVTCPDDISIEISASTSPIRVFWKEPTLTDGNLVDILSQSHTPGSSFPVNTDTTVTYAFNDNTNSECFFNIAINVDKVISSPDACGCEPSLSIENCPADFIHQEPAFCGTVPVSWTEPSATDGCGGTVQVEKTHAPGAEFSVGTTTISYTFTDSSQNQQTCEFDVSVSVIRIEDDSIRPVIFNCPEHIYEVLEPGQTTLDILWDPPTARDGSGLPVTVQQTHSPGDQFTAGGYELVKYTFTDAAGNEAVCEFAVTVYPNGVAADTVPPTASGCGNTVTLYPTAGSTTADYNVVWPTATDNDGQTPVRITTHQPGIQSFPLGRTVIDAYYYDTSGNRASCYRIIIVRLQGAAPVTATVKNCPVNVYLEIPEGTSTRICWEEPILTDGAGNTIATGLGYQSHHPGAEFVINGCREQVVNYFIFDYYGTETRCAFSVTIRAIGHENLPGEWSRWYDGDNPSGNCDCEERGYQIAETPCATGEPVDAQCQTLTGEDWRSVGLIPSIPEKRGQVAWCCPRLGFNCFNYWNTLYNQRCLDYRVRFKCPLPAQ